MTNPRSAIRVAIHSLGCKVNQYEASKVGAQFSKAGYQLCSPEEKADVYIVNTCTVTHVADRTSRKLVRQALRKNGQSLVVVTGCHAEAWSGAAPGVQVLKVPQTEKNSLYAKVEEALFGKAPEILEDLDYHTIIPISNRTKAYLKIQDGCDRYCTYCIIPFIRGKSRSRPVAEILNEAEILMQNHQEIVITGICVGDYGRDLPKREKLSSLLQQLLALPYSGRFRLSSIDPCDMDEQLVETMTTHPRACRHLHLALQHGSDRILRRMGRDYSTQEFFVLCSELRKKAPHFAITADLMAGFPGETEEEFQRSLDFAQIIGFSKIHVFPYSERKKTGAAKHPHKVPDNVREQRAEALVDLSRGLTRLFFLSCLGLEEEILVEHERDKKTGMLEGYTSNYIPVIVQGNDDLKGKIAKVKLKALLGDKVSGELLG